MFTWEGVILHETRTNVTSKTVIKFCIPLSFFLFFLHLYNSSLYSVKTILHHLNHLNVSKCYFCFLSIGLNHALISLEFIMETSLSLPKVASVSICYEYFIDTSTIKHVLEFCLYNNLKLCSLIYCFATF